MRHPDGRPQVVAHRGSSFTNPEHTLAAYVRALDEGADALECDVRLTSDGHLVCVHDRTLERVTGTRGSVVSTMRLDQLDELDFGSWKNPWADLDDEAPDMDVDAKKVLTMRRLLETVRDYDRPSTSRSRQNTPRATPAWSSAAWCSCSTSSAGPGAARRRA